jgi:thiamine pyrophosphokinase
MTQVVVVIGGGTLDQRGVAAVSSPAALIAADSGLDDAVAAGLTPTHLVGDLDSLSAGGRMWAYEHRLPIDEYPTDKGDTDTALALALSSSFAATELLVLGGSGTRLDHTLGTITALGGTRLAGFTSVTAWLGTHCLHVVHPGRSCVVRCRPGDVFSLVAMHGPCSGVSVTGARWPLDHVELHPGSTLGISNEATDEPWVTCGSGVLTVVVP